MPEFANVQELVRSDVVEGLGPAFQATSGYELLEAFDGKDLPVGAVTFVPWRYGCRHVGEFQGIEATEREIAIVGVTAVEDADTDHPIFHRFIDWANVFAQLGLTIGARPVVTK